MLLEISNAALQTCGQNAMCMCTAQIAALAYSCGWCELIDKVASYSDLQPSLDGWLSVKARSVLLLFANP